MKDEKETTYDYPATFKPDPNANGRDRGAGTLKVRIDGSMDECSVRVTPSGHVRRDSIGNKIEY